MTLQELKAKIENKDVTDIDSIVFIIQDIDFIPIQYANELALLLGKELQWISDIDSFINYQHSLFYSDDNILSIYKCDEFSHDLTSIKNLIVICKKTDYNNTIEVPKLESWQIKDYVYSKCEGISTTNLDWLINSCNEDIYRLEQEINKISIFNKDERKYLFDDFIQDNIFSDLTDKNIFDFSNAVQTKDLDKLHDVYLDIENADVEPLGLVTILYQNFKKMIRVWCQRFANERNTGLKKNQIYAINRLPKVYSQEQLIKAFQILCKAEFLLKSGQISEKLLVDYIVVKVLSL